MSAEHGLSGDLSDDERFWKDLSPWLKERGYTLRARYQPGWKPSWLKKNRSPHLFEDGHEAYAAGLLIDAVRASDKKIVVMKKTTVPDPANPTRELRMNESFRSGLIPVDNPHNHCVPVYEILQVPENDNTHLLVMPLLRDWLPYWGDAPFDTVGEALGFVRQIFEGVQLLHHNRIAHNDIKFDNIMVDSGPLYRRPMHPINSERRYDWSGKESRRSITRHPVKYYLIDFGSTVQYDLDSGPAQERCGYGGDRSVPEFKSNPEGQCDPFPVEIYRLGHIIQGFLMTSLQMDEPDKARNVKVNHAMDFMSPLVTDMMQEDPKKRPTIDQVMLRFDEVVKGLGFFKLRALFWPDFDDEENFVVRTFWTKPRHFVLQIINILGRYPAIPPTPSPPSSSKDKKGEKKK
ncbi:hypothetical protein K435DRAFT_868768 [Dendrothele bispora CBS 962.96]|uniref:Protein kinase domain-containing protein n=1 Tax=Dendrothele bispora (strain CBS 962.96) TaxID=1314807 RepID=A0A4S8LC77_DENBC|nr:hypothetical protein K435DRAFT_868768 [Dendrothele bispora CBS 962.96]